MICRAGRPRPFDIFSRSPASVFCRPTQSIIPLSLTSRQLSQQRNIPLNPLPARTTDPPAVFTRIKNQISLLHSTDGGGPSDSEVNIFNETTDKLQTTLQKRDFCEALSLWSLLEQQKLLHFLGPSQLESLSKQIAKSCASHQPSDAQDETEILVIEKIALFTAARRATSALCARMLFHIIGGNPDAVLELYERFLELSKQRGNWEGNESTVEGVAAEEESYDALAPTPTSECDDYNHRRAALLLAVTTAYAMKDSFAGALQTSLAASLRLSPTHVKLFLRKLRHDLPLQQKVEEYTRRLDVARLVIRQPSLIKHVTNLSKTQATRPLEKLYNSVIQGLSGPDAYLAAHPSAVVVGFSKPLVITEIAWTSLLSAFLKVARIDLAEKLWDDMLKFGVSIGVPMWTALFDGYDSMGAVKEVLNGWDTMISEGLTPDALTHRALISTLFNGKQPDEALRRFRTFEKLKVSSAWDPAHILSVYNTVLHGLLLNSRPDDAITHFQAMKDEGPKPDIISYNTVLRYYCRRGDFKAVASQVRNLTSDGLVGDVFTFSTILSALLKVGREDAPQMMVDLMQRQGVKPNVATYSAIIDRQVRERNENNLAAALRLLQKMEQDPQLQPNEVTYTAILAGLYRGQWLDPRVAEKHRQDIMRRMRRRNVQPNRLTYLILLKACLQNPEPEGLQSALLYYKQMGNRKMPMYHESWYVLLHGLMDRGEWSIASEMVEDMMQSGFQPTGALSNLVSTIRRRTAKKIR
jgi:pentatricopeptide repeat protein